jgi:Alginate export
MNLKTTRSSMVVFAIMALLLVSQFAFAGPAPEADAKAPAAECKDCVDCSDCKTFKLCGSMRYRGELVGEDYDANTSPGGFNLFQTRINAYYQQGQFMSFVQLQQADNLDADGNTGTDMGINVHQAYFTISDFLIKKTALQVGRMELKYGDQRLVGNVGWSNFGRAFEGFKIMRRCEMMEVDLFAMKLDEDFDNNPEGYNGPDNDFYGLWAKYKPLKINVFAFHQVGDFYNSNSFYNSDRVARTTAGFHYANCYDMGLSVSTTFASQFGTYQDQATAPNTDIDLSAYMFRLALMYKLDVPFVHGIGGGIDMASGDDSDPADVATNNQFNNLYWTGHKFNGDMDIFTNNHPEFGLNDIFIKVAAKPIKGIHAALVFHNFAYNVENFAATDKFTGLGNEIDLHFKTKIHDQVGVYAGIGYFMPSEDYKPVNNDARMHAFVQLSTKFSLID